MNATDKLINALQHVTSTMQQRIDNGERSPAIDTHDLIEVLLVIAERLEAADTAPTCDVLPTGALAEIARADLDIPDLLLRSDTPKWHGNPVPASVDATDARLKPRKAAGVPHLRWFPVLLVKRVRQIVERGLNGTETNALVQLPGTGSPLKHAAIVPPR